jgi:hypothetical protein
MAIHKHGKHSVIGDQLDQSVSEISLISPTCLHGTHNQKPGNQTQERRWDQVFDCGTWGDLPVKEMVDDRPQADPAT